MPNQKRRLDLDNWFSRNALSIARTLEILFGIVWAIDGSFKLQPMFISNFSSIVGTGAQGQPQWMAPWFSFWSSATASDPQFFAYMIAFFEIALAISLIFGFLRKIGYSGGFILSLVIWSVPEGFGGPYGPGSTDIGTGIIYAFVFIFLAVINGTYGSDRRTLDYLIEKKVRLWKLFAEIKH